MKWPVKPTYIDASYTVTIVDGILRSGRIIDQHITGCETRKDSSIIPGKLDRTLSQTLRLALTPERQH